LGFIGKKQKHVSTTETGYGDVCTFVALDAGTDMIPVFAAGNRAACHAKAAHCPPCGTG